MRSGHDDKGNLWFRMSRWLRASAWLPPGLALVWLATLATFVHGVGIMIAAWGATVSLVVLVVLLVERRHATSSASSAATTTGNPAPGVVGELPAAGTNTAAGPGDGMGEEGPSGASPSPAPAGPVLSPSADLDPAPAPKPPQPVVAGPALNELRVLTAEEVASTLRVGTDLIITAITKGELPGNRIGSHWRIDQGALTRWLQGSYGEHPGRDSNR
jgi:excisionase family DNA binding protein